MLNNRGQSLVIFIVMIPIFLLLMILIYDMGNLAYERHELDSINKIVIDYGLDNINNLDLVKEMYSLAKSNNDNINNEIHFKNNKLYINSKYEGKGVFTKILNVDGYMLKSSYRGYIDNNKNEIERIK